jgi:hypothetical protein
MARRTGRRHSQVGTGIPCTRHSAPWTTGAKIIPGLHYRDCRMLPSGTPISRRFRANSPLPGIAPGSMLRPRTADRQCQSCQDGATPARRAVIAWCEEQVRPNFSLATSGNEHAKFICEPLHLHSNNTCPNEHAPATVQLQHWYSALIEYLPKRREDRKMTVIWKAFRLFGCPCKFVQNLFWGWIRTSTIPMTFK